MKDGGDNEYLESILIKIGFNNNSILPIKSKWSNNSSTIANVLLTRTIANNKLLDMDWSFGVTASSDDCNQLGKTFLQMKVKVDTGDDGIKDLFFEMSLEQFYSFLAQAEKCKSFLDVLCS